MPISQRDPVRTTLTERALESIRTRIVEGDLSLGEAVTESGLAAELSMSKTPVREALLQLKREGLVEVQPKRGSFVFRMGGDEVRQISDFRCLLEREALAGSMAHCWGQLVDRLEPCVSAMGKAIRSSDLPAYRRLDAEFHASIIRFCGNVFLIAAGEQCPNPGRAREDRGRHCRAQPFRSRPPARRTHRWHAGRLRRDCSGDKLRTLRRNRCQGQA
jgi:DNA-binding GntR family transcriptional regulator